jgi:crotonobetainyl-CoA:carnitine CoA-transferase CaiB-like acyl-CoA transferase
MAGHDINYIAMSGLLELITSDVAPTLPDVQIADLAGGSAQLTIGILLALQARERTGRGQRVDVSMVSGMRNLLSIPLATLRGGKRETRRGNELLSGAYACYNLYPTRDGRWLALGALEEEFWSNLCYELGREDLVGDQFAPEPRQSEIKQELARIFSTRNADEWFHSLRSCDCCVTPVRSLSEAVSDGYFERGKPPVSLSGTPAEYPCGCTSRVGEHSEEVLQRFGVSQEELCVLKQAGVVQSTSRQMVVESKSVAQE